MTPKKKNDNKEVTPAVKKVAAKSAHAKVPEAAKPAHAEASAEKAGPKRMVLKTLKRASVAPPSPTLHRVTGVMTRRVIPKAPPPKPVPVAPPPGQVDTVDQYGQPLHPKGVGVPPPLAPKPIEKKAAPPVETKATAALAAKPTPAPKETKKPLETKKESAKSEPTATYKMPPPSPIKTPMPRPVPKTGHTTRPDHDTARPGDRGAGAQELEPALAASAVAAPARQKLRIPEVVTVKELSDKLNVKPIEVIKKLLGLGTMVTINQQIDTDIATLAADAFGFDVEIVPLIGEAEAVDEQEDPAKLKPRPPVVTIMGHVDHGKTSLLDAIRKTRVAEKEAGGITQHIGAYRVSTPKGDVVFLDTPGHEAFTAMRARGAKVTDMVVLVVAADDGVMPQTVEAIDHARAAGVPIVVAVNKIDLPTADVERIRRELAQHQLLSEEWGGKTVFVEVSAKKGTNIDKLLEMLLLEAELMELKANPDRSAQGVVVEAKLDPRRGVAATLLVQRGTLKASDIVVAGFTYGRARAILDDAGARINEAGPSTPVEVLGLSAVPQAGDRFTVLADEREARTLVERRQMSQAEEAQKRRHVTLENLHARVAEGKVRELKIVLKADVQGSVQALRDSLERMSTDEIRLNVIHSGVGGINETDVTLAAASDAVVIGFSVRADAKSEDLARKEEVEVKTYRIIYEAIADVRASMEGLLEPEKTEIKLGRAEIRDVFKLSKGGTIGGSFVLEGKLTRGSKIRVIRDGVVAHVGVLESLRRFKDDVKEVEKGFECGIGLGNFQDIKAKDIVEAYTEETKARKLEPQA